MEKTFFLILLVFSLSTVALAQTITAKHHVSKDAVVVDTSGMKYPYAVWKKMVSTGYYRLKKIDRNNDSSGYLILKRDSAQLDHYMGRLQKPQESPFFTVGNKIKSFSAKDIDGNKIVLKELEGKIVVLNFWFIGCGPCRREIPDLSNIALQYKDNPDVVFISIGIDGKYQIKDYIKNNPLSYHIIPNGQDYADLYKVNLFPTNVILDKDGTVLFHTMGVAKNTPYWIKQTIVEAISSSQ